MEYNTVRPGVETGETHDGLAFFETEINMVSDPLYFHCYHQRRSEKSKRLNS